ncbi:VOC family protein [Microbacterium esteraromaticum]|uniref:VOC family protein n=1 Tax=Microbacterium esteraromaticum TaxID=57043 RepID=UPI00195B1541|nr:VOC family protein [Microbacterium esteraromaticum]MBM7464732.1 putative glyoxalase superfamily protein PhnB [Microbacterium esteraromaticum]
MNITRTAISLNVADITASAAFATTHFGYQQEMAADGFVSLTHPTGGGNIIFLETGLSTFRPSENAGPAGQGLLLVFVIDDLDAQYARIAASGARVVTEPETEPWGERYCQFADPNGIIWQLVQWVD